MANQLLLLLWKSWKTFIRSRGWLIAQAVTTALMWLICIGLLFLSSNGRVNWKANFTMPFATGHHFKCLNDNAEVGCSSQILEAMKDICSAHPGLTSTGSACQSNEPLGEIWERDPIGTLLIREMSDTSIDVVYTSNRTFLMGPRMHASRQFGKSSSDTSPFYNTEVFPMFTKLAERAGNMSKLTINPLDVTYSKSMFDESNFNTWVFIIAFFFTIMVFSLNATIEVSQEASTQIKDYLLSMGMSRTLYFLHHFIFHFLKSWISVVVVSAIAGAIGKSASLALYLLFIFSLAFAALISMSLMIGSAFTVPKNAMNMSTILWILIFAANSMLPTVRRTNGFSLLCCFSPLYAVYLAMDAKKESDLRGMNLWFSDVKYAIPQGYYILMLVFDTVFYFAMAIFIDWLRNSCENPLTKIMKGNKLNEDTEDDSRALLENQEKSEGQTAADLIVEGLHKVYSTGEHAVKGVDIRLHRGQVTALLGHNGAGKSTIFSMISGMIVPTKGRIQIMDAENRADRQKLIGFCPQYNPIFPKLTVNEHLSFFASLKDCETGDETGQKVLSLLGMDESGTVCASKLSGGMKRKLCMAISMAANSPIVLLDEPTAGLDPGARRDFEKLLLEWKKEHTILLTTHYTDEAELLADRIFIMAKGKVFCSGSPQFLRKKFDSGFVLSFAIKNDADAEKASTEMLNIVKEFVPEVSLYKSRGKQFELKLTTDSKKFVEMFRKIEEVGPSVGMQSYGLSLNKLEQVFLKVGEMTGAVDRTAEVQTALKELIQENENRGEGFARASKQMAYTMLKRLQYDVAHVQSLIIITASIFLITLGLLSVAKNITADADEESMLFIAERYRIGVNSAKFDKFEDLAGRFGHYLEIVEAPPDAQAPAWYSERATSRPPLLGVITEGVQRQWTIHIEPRDLRFLPTLEAMAAMVANPLLEKVKFLTKQQREDTMKHLAKHLEGFGKKVQSVLELIPSWIVCRPLTFYIVERTSNFGHQERLTGFSRILFLLASFFYDFALYLLHFLAFLLGCVAFSPAATGAAMLQLIYLPLLLFLSGELIILIFYRYFATRSRGEMLIHLAIFMLGETARFGMAAPQFIKVSEWMKPLFYTQFLASPMWTAIWMKEEEDVEGSKAKIYGPIMIVVHFAVLVASLIQVEMYRKKRPKPSTEGVEQGNDMILRVNNLRKSYGKGETYKTAVNGISFGVRAHECFGVLGINGAGKTSTFEILTGNTTPDEGSATVGGVDCSKPAIIGYCPQADALVDDLTGRQSLVILAALHGYENPQKVADIVITCVGMQSHADKKTKRYSGGQRRKISVAASLLAQNSLIILDEPTAGIDPIARRDIWSVICALRESTNTAIVLTSHSMDEVEALVSNLIIMREGSIVVEGSPQMVKNSFGDHYSFNLMIDNVTDVTQVTSQVLSVFPTASLYDSASLRNIKYRIPRSSSDVFSSIFEKAAGIADQLKAADFCFTQATLEDAFILASTGIQHPMGVPGPVPVGPVPNPDGTTSTRPSEAEPVLATTMDPTAVSGTQTGTKSVTKSEPMSSPSTN